MTSPDTGARRLTWLGQAVPMLLAPVRHHVGTVAREPRPRASPERAA